MYVEWSKCRATILEKKSSPQIRQICPRIEDPGEGGLKVGAGKCIENLKKRENARFPVFSDLGRLADFKIPAKARNP